MAKKVQAYIKLQVKAGEANPSPPVGPALGQHGVNIMEFCKAFNAKTQSMEKGLPTPVVITVYTDRSFTFITKTPPAGVLLKKAAGIDKGSGTPNSAKVGTVTREQLEEALHDIRGYGRYVLSHVFDSPDGWELQNLLTVAQLMTEAALKRTESRGVHMRKDFPEPDDKNWRKHLAFQFVPADQ